MTPAKRRQQLADKWADGLKKAMDGNASFDRAWLTRVYMRHLATDAARQEARRLRALNRQSRRPTGGR